MLYRELILTSAITIALAGQANAQDRWAGYYAGLSLDAIETSSNVGSNATHRYSDDGLSLGVYAGHNFVRDNGFVWGPEVALTGLSTSGTRADGALGSSKSEGSFLLSPRVRLGYATDRAFYYGMLGLGFSDLGAQPASNTGTDIYVSGSIGLGAEFALTDRWSTKVEAVHYKWQDDTKVFNATNQTIKSEMTQITVGLSRKF